MICPPVTVAPSSSVRVAPELTVTVPVVLVTVPSKVAFATFALVGVPVPAPATVMWPLLVTAPSKVALATLVLDIAPIVIFPVLVTAPSKVALAAFAPVPERARRDLDVAAIVDGTLKGRAGRSRGGTGHADRAGVGDAASDTERAALDDMRVALVVGNAQRRRRVSVVNRDNKPEH